MELNGATAIITGAARGIGKGIALAYAGRGARVALVDVLADALQETAREITRAGGVALAVPTDTTVQQQVDALPARVEAALGPADILVNCAGRLSVIGPLWETDPERWFRDVTTNLYGTFLCCRAVARVMIGRGRGYILNLVGGGVDDPHAYTTAYACSKVGVLRLSEALAQEVQPFGVKVFALQPPAVRTAMTEFIAQSPEGRQWRPGFEAYLEREGEQALAVIVGLALQLISGKADALSGRYLEAQWDLDEVLESADSIVRDDRLTLRIRR